MSSLHPVEKNQSESIRIDLKSQKRQLYAQWVEWSAVMQ